jgi:hypothetical protein
MTNYSLSHHAKKALKILTAEYLALAASEALPRTAAKSQQKFAGEPMARLQISSALVFF